MSTLMFVIFGVPPVIVLGLLAFAPLIAGIAMILDEPSTGALLIAWAIAGLCGARTMLRVWSGVYTENTAPGLVAGILAAAPLTLPSLLDPNLPGSLVPLYFTVGPIVMALLVLAGWLPEEPRDDARIIEYEEV